jgi:hypothetical protein
MRAAFLLCAMCLIVCPRPAHAKESVAYELEEEQLERIREVWKSATRDVKTCVQGLHDDCRTRMWRALEFAFPEKLARLVNPRAPTTTAAVAGTERNSVFLYERAPAFRWLNAALAHASCDQGARTLRLDQPLPDKLRADNDALLKVLDEASRELVGLDRSPEGQQLLKLRQTITGCLGRA